MGGSIIQQLCLQERWPLWSEQIADNMQGMEIDGLCGLGSECVYWVDEMTEFSSLSLAFALLSPTSLDLEELSLSVLYSHLSMYLHCSPSLLSQYHIPFSLSSL